MEVGGDPAQFRARRDGTIAGGSAYGSENIDSPA